MEWDGVECIDSRMALAWGIKEWDGMVWDVIRWTDVGQEREKERNEEG
jgi:hypothetical protein